MNSICRISLQQLFPCYLIILHIVENSCNLVKRRLLDFAWVTEPALTQGKLGDDNKNHFELNMEIRDAAYHNCDVYVLS